MEKNKDTRQEIMDRIEKEHIVPVTKVHFVVRNTLLWIVGVAASLLGAVTMSVVFFSLFNTDRFIYERLGRDGAEYVLAAIPAVWMLILLVFGVLAVYEVRHTKRGYRYRVRDIVGLNILVSIILGYVLFAVGLAHPIERGAGTFLPYYTRVEDRMEEVWTNPDKGLLSGIVLGTTTEGAYVLEDADSHVWNISPEELEEQDIERLEEGFKVRMVGVQVATSTFKPCVVGPWSMSGENKELARRQMMARQMRAAELDVIEGEVETNAPVSSPQKEQSGSMEGSQQRKGQMNTPTITPRESGMRPETRDERNNFRMRSIECETQTDVLTPRELRNNQ